MCICNSQFCVLCIVYLSGEVLCACMFIHIVYCTKHLTDGVETDLENFFFIYFNPTSHTCDFRYVKNIT